MSLACSLQKGFTAYAAGNGRGSARAIAFKTASLRVPHLTRCGTLVADYFAGDTLAPSVRLREQ